MLCACVIVCGAAGERKCLKSPHFIHTIFFLWHHEVISRCFFVMHYRRCAIYINVDDAALVVFRSSIAYNCYLLNMYMPLAMRYCATGTACKFFTVPMTNTLCTEPIDSISPRRLSTKS